MQFSMAQEYLGNSFQISREEPNSYLVYCDVSPHWHVSCIGRGWKKVGSHYFENHNRCQTLVIILFSAMFADKENKNPEKKETCQAHSSG